MGLSFARVPLLEKKTKTQNPKPSWGARILQRNESPFSCTVFDPCLGFGSPRPGKIRKLLPCWRGKIPQSLSLGHACERSSTWSLSECAFLSWFQVATKSRRRLKPRKPKANFESNPSPILPGPCQRQSRPPIVRRSHWRGRAEQSARLRGRC